MFCKRILCFLALLACLAGPLNCAAAEVDCDSTYCFTAGDFSGEEELSGICVTGLPDPETGTVMLGSRIIRPGDILTADQLANYPLEDTGETIPNFRDVLALYAGKAPLIIELKAIDGNHAALCEAACKAMEGYEGPWCMESFDPRCVIWLKKNRPDIIRGQLAENSLKNEESKLPWILKEPNGPQVQGATFS